MSDKGFKAGGTVGFGVGMAHSLLRLVLHHPIRLMNTS